MVCLFFCKYIKLCYKLCPFPPQLQADYTNLNFYNNISVIYLDKLFHLFYNNIRYNFNDYINPHFKQNSGGLS